MNILSFGLVFCLFAVFSIMVFSKEESKRFNQRPPIQLVSRPAKAQENDHQENHNGTVSRPSKAKENDHQENHNGTVSRPAKAQEKAPNQNRPFKKD